MLAVKSGLEKDVARQQAYQPAREVEPKPRSVAIDAIAQRQPGKEPCIDSECGSQPHYPEELRTVRHHPPGAGSFKAPGAERVRYVDFMGQWQLMGA